MHQVRVGIVGSGGIGLAYAAWIAHTGHSVSIWSPRGSSDALRDQPLKATGVLEATVRVTCVESAQELARDAEVFLIAVPVNGHKRVMDELLPHLRSGQTIIVSSMGSLSSLYLGEAAHAAGLALRVASFGTTVMTARRKQATHVNVMTRRPVVAVSCLPSRELPEALRICGALFGDGFVAEENPLISTLSNSAATSHVPLALFNWTRIERAEEWPQYHYMTAHVAAVIEKLDAERLAVAAAYGVNVSTGAQGLRRSFKIDAPSLAEIAAEMHKRRGGPPGPTDTKTRFLTEDVPFGLVFFKALGDIANVPVPVTNALIATSSLICGEDFTEQNDLIPALRLASESVEGLRARTSSVEAK